jgi:hypothetical protein
MGFPLLRRIIRQPCISTRKVHRFFSRPPARIRLKLMFLRSREHDLADTTSAYGLDRCDVVYINLAHRLDRRIHIEEELRSLEVTAYTRFDAVLHERGSLGCARSHQEVLRDWNAAPGRLLAILEDDCTVVVARRELDALVDEFAVDDRLDVLVVANNSAWKVPISQRLATSADIQTMAFYILKQRAIPPLLRNAAQSVRRLTDGAPDHVAAIDILWKRVQKRHVFAVPRHQVARQLAGYSDIQNDVVDYGC